MATQYQLASTSPLPPPVVLAPRQRSDAATELLSAVAAEQLVLLWRPLSDHAGHVFCQEAVPQLLVRGHHRLDLTAFDADLTRNRRHADLDSRVVGAVLAELAETPSTAMLVWVNAASLAAGGDIVAMLAAKPSLAGRLIIGIRGTTRPDAQGIAALRRAGVRLALGNFDGSPDSIRQMMALAPDMVAIDDDALAADRSRLARVADLAAAGGAAVVLGFRSAARWRERAATDDARWQAALTGGPASATPEAHGQRDAKPAPSAWRGAIWLLAIAAPWLAITGTWFAFQG